MKPKVSVIVPIYGVEKYIERCAISLFEQALQEIEFIFVDDCSPDNSVQILESVIERYPIRKPWITILRLLSNGGSANARREGIRVAKGEYIIHCDSDDWVEKDIYYKLYSKAIQGNYDIVICDYYIAYSKDKKKSIHQSIPLSKEELLHLVLREKVHSALWNKMVNRKIYQRDLSYPKDSLREDLALMTQLIFYAQSIGFINESMYNYFYNENSITNQYNDQHRLFMKLTQAINNYKIIESFLANQNSLLNYQADLLRMRYYILSVFTGLTVFKGGLKQWNSFYPDLSISGIFVFDIPFQSKAAFILAKMGLFNVVKQILKFLKVL